MLDLTNLYYESVIAAVHFKREWRFYVDDLPTWIMNREAYSPGSDPSLPGHVAHWSVPPNFVFRNNIYVVDDSNAEAFCCAIEPCEVTVAGIRKIIQGDLLKSIQLQIIIDFDNRLFVDGTLGEDLCRFVPPEWTCIEDYPLQKYMPESIDVWPRGPRSEPYLWEHRIGESWVHAVRHSDQRPLWPEAGQHVLAFYGEESVTVYQAYRPSIGKYAVRCGSFGGEFSYNRMSWIKPNFLWMMYRSGWGTKDNQEVTLAIRIKRSFFDWILAQSVPSSYDEGSYANKQDWSAAIAASEVRCQWDPDHEPSGAPVERRAIQLGLRGSALKQFGGEAILSIDDISKFVAEQRMNIGSEALLTPRERVYIPSDPAIVKKLRLSGF